MPGPVSDEAAKGRSSLLSPVVLCRGTGTRREGERERGGCESVCGVWAHVLSLVLCLSLRVVVRCWYLVREMHVSASMRFFICKHSCIRKLRWEVDVCIKPGFVFLFLMSFIHTPHHNILFPSPQTAR